MSQAVLKSGSIGGNSFLERRLRYTGPTDSSPFVPSLPFSTLWAKLFIILDYYSMKPEQALARRTPTQSIYLSSTRIK